MADKHGGKRKGSGRKPKTDEEAKLKLMRSVLPDSDFMKRVASKIKEGDAGLMKLWFEHLYGKPKERIENEHTFKPNNFDSIFIKPPEDNE